jgi:hypothetical protein
MVSTSIAKSSLLPKGTSFNLQIRKTKIGLIYEKEK